ncbi:MAG: RidA family protein [Gemmatimonadota bacterium]|nr:RidA family protein [Gemmatimonadota bacterium]
MSNYENKLLELNITLPTPASPVANYVGFVKVANMVFISGQLPLENGKLQGIGKVGKEISVDDAKKYARLCAINILAQLKVACGGNLDNVQQCVKLGIFVNGDVDFKDHPAVANGASDLIAEVFADAGKHARAAVGSGSLPFGVAVEVDAIFVIK